MKNFKTHILVTGLLLLFTCGAHGQNFDGILKNCRFGPGALNEVEWPNVKGKNNLTYGFDALATITTGNQNVAIGNYSLYLTNIGNGNTAIGYGALSSVGAGNNNTAIGYYAGIDSNNLTNTTAIGSNAKVSESNSIQLGNTNVTKVKAGGDNTTFLVKKIDANEIKATALKIGDIPVVSSQWATSNGKISYGSNVGIGTTNPTEKLEVNGTIKATSIKFADGTTLSTTVPDSPWKTSGTNIYTGLSLNVGIGTTAPPTVKLEIGTDDASDTRTMLKVHGGATFNNDGPDDTDKAKTTQVSINTNKKIKNAALTVAGVTFIGAWGELETLDGAGENNSLDDVVNGTIKDEHYDKFNLWVTKGIVSEDYTITEKKDWADHVFRDEYKLATLNEVAAFIKENKHLPGVISEKEVKEKGYNLHNVNRSFLEKIENLYLYSIAQEKALKLQQEKINTQEEKINRMEQGFSELKAALEKVNQQK